jgi:hypothetical protein
VEVQKRAHKNEHVGRCGESCRSSVANKSRCNDIGIREPSQLGRMRDCPRKTENKRGVQQPPAIIVIFEGGRHEKSYSGALASWSPPGTVFLGDVRKFCQILCNLNQTAFGALPVPRSWHQDLPRPQNFCQNLSVVNLELEPAIVFFGGGFLQPHSSGPSSVCVLPLYDLSFGPSSTKDLLPRVDLGLCLLCLP